MSIFLMNAVLIVNGKSHIIVNVSLSAPIAQGIERWSPEPGAQVRILVGAPLINGISQGFSALPQVGRALLIFLHPVVREKGRVLP
jgi:hypothetical protein